MKQILVINGPNLNLLGKREPEIYGFITLDEVNDEVGELCKSKSVKPVFFQSNHEGKIIDLLHDSITSINGLIINPGGLTHTSVVLRDAVKCLNVPKVEVHISNIHSREPFRKHSMLSDIVDCVIAGAGTKGYIFGTQYLLSKISN